MPDGAKVEVKGLADFRRELRRIGPAWPKELRQANKDAAELVAREAQRRAPRGPHEGGGRVAPLWTRIRPLGSQTVGRVASGGAAAPHGPVYEFGGSIRRHASQSKTRVRAHPYLYPALDARRDEVTEFYGEAIDRLTRRAFPGRGFLS